MNTSTTFNTAKKQAHTIIEILQTKANKRPDKFGENFGQDEVMKFEDKLQRTHLTYLEKCSVMEILYSRVYDIVPQRR